MSRDLGLLYAYRIVSRLYFHLPILFVFFVSVQEFSIFEAELLLGVFGLAVTLAFPLGGRLRGALPLKWIVALGEVLKLAGLGLVIATGSIWIVAIGQALNGIGFSLTQSTDTALLGRVAPDPDANAKAQSNTQSYMFLSVLAAGIGGALIFQAEPNAAFLAAMGSALLAAIIVAIVREPRAEAKAARTAARAAQDAVAIEPQQEWWMRFYVLVRAITLAVFIGFLPYLFFVRLALSVELFGVVLGVFSVAAFVGARYATAVLSSIGDERTMQLTVGLNLASLALLAVEPPLAIAIFAMGLLGLSVGGVRPLTMRGLGARRGELVGLMERRFGITNALILVAGGALLDATDFPTLMVTLTAVYAVCLAVFLGRGVRVAALHPGANAGG